MVKILLRLTAEVLFSLMCIKGIVSLAKDKKMKLLDRIGINLYEWFKPAAFAWLGLVELYLIRGWVECLTFCKSIKSQGYTGVAVLILWAWAFIVCCFAPMFAGFKKWFWLLLAVIMMAITSGTVLTLL